MSIVETEGTRARPRTSFSNIILLEFIGTGGSMGGVVIGGAGAGAGDSSGVSSSV